MNEIVARRQFLLGSGGLAGACAAGLTGCATPLGESTRPTAGLRAAEPVPAAVLPTAPGFPPLHASIDRIIKITVCTRPFRAEGPRLDVERFGHQTVVHNYGHGGSGWSLSWGSSAIAAGHAMAIGHRDIAVIGAGALGLTSAILLQRAGAKVTIYAKERFPDVRSANATGTWSPDSRICLGDRVTPAFKQLWERMCRQSFRSYTNYLGLPADPVEWIDTYALSDLPPKEARAKREAGNTIKFARLSEELVKDMTPAPVDLAAGTHPFPAPYVRRTSHIIFNITAYARLLMSDFLSLGGRIETREFASPSDFATVHQKTLVNATGYGARALLGDDSVIPVRGQLTRLVPQPEVRYGVAYHGTSMVPRRDGIVLQAAGSDEAAGYNDASIDPDLAEASMAVSTMADLYDRMPKPSAVLATL